VFSSKKNIEGGSSMKKLVAFIVVTAMVLTSVVFAVGAPFPRSWLWSTTELKMMDTSEYKKPAPYTIGFSNASISNSWRVFFERQVRYGAEELYKSKIKRFYVTDANDKPDKQIADVEDLVARGIDALIISAATMAALDPVVRRTMRRGIPVVCVDRRVSSDNFVSFVTSSNYTQGRMQMLWLCEMLGGKGNIVMLGGIAGAGPAEERAAGGREVLSAFPGIKVLDFQYANWSPAEGKRIMSALIQKYGRQIDGVWGDGLQTSGAMEALKEAGMKVPITGDHLNAFIVRAAEWGFPAMSIDFPVSMGTDAVEITLKVLNGEPVPFIVDVPRTVICTQDTENVQSDVPWSSMVHKEWPDEAWINTLPDKFLPY
jgi:ribose transport system substrate-binding protein